jgi:hypothetical protein
LIATMCLRTMIYSLTMIILLDFERALGEEQ